MRIEVLLQRVHVGALKWRLPAWWSSTPNPQCTSLREANANLVRCSYNLSVKSNRCLFIDTFALYGRFRHFFSKLVRFFLALYGFWPLLFFPRLRLLMPPHFLSTRLTPLARESQAHLFQCHGLFEYHDVASTSSQDTIYCNPLL